MERMSREQSASEGRSRADAPPGCNFEFPGFQPPDPANDLRMSRLARTIEEEIVPRLMLAHRTTSEMPLHPPASRHIVTEDDVRQFAKVVLSQDEDVALATIHTLRSNGVSVEKIYLDLLAPTARHLGKLWEDDLCNFTDVTVGLGRLQRVLRELSPQLCRTSAHSGQSRRVLLLPGPGEQHTFGLSMVAEFFRRAGWDVSGGAWDAETDAAALVGTEWFDAIGYSLGAEVHLPQLAAIIGRVRHLSCNRHLVVLVGGPLFGLQPEFVDRVGADGMTIDGREAPFLAESLIAERAPRSTSRA